MTILVTLWFISKNKKQKGKALFIDARKMGYMVDRKHRDFKEEDIAKLSKTFAAFQEGRLGGGQRILRRGGLGNDCQTRLYLDPWLLCGH